jgi:serine kinase of HPr protein (carbohydrate metabolism regulator)
MSEPSSIPSAVEGLVHATVVARYRPEGWRGVLITGGSGAGKSDLALRLIGFGWRLIADDYAWVWSSGGGLYANAPSRTAGLIEARGVGVTATPFVPSVRVVLAIHCVSEEPERLPDPGVHQISGVSVPSLSLNPLHASAPWKVEAALAATRSAAWAADLSATKGALGPVTGLA